jgi:arylsulfatase A-like enzyme
MKFWRTVFRRHRPGLRVVLLAASLAWPLSAGSAERPNIVFILADDLGSFDVGWRGGEIKTPHLDKLALAGARLEQFYVQPVCSPTRAALMTGRYPMRYGLQVGVIRPNARYGLPLEERLLPQALREAGYTTAMVGKWHLGSFESNYWPNARGFDSWYGHLFGAIDYFKHTRDDKHDWFRDGEPNHDEGYSTHLLAREAVRILRDHPTHKPLFLYVAFNAVHAPLQVPAEYKKPYERLPEPRRTYAGMVAALDEAVGQIASAIDESGRRKNTLIIFCSDNGGPRPGTVTSNNPLRAGKTTLYEGGVRVAAFAAWEGHIPPGTVTTPLHIVDWYPTLLKLAGASPRQKLPLDGVDLWPCLTAGKPSRHKEILLNSTPTVGALRMGDWKLVVHNTADTIASRRRANRTAGAFAPRSDELFNLVEDPQEKNNVAGAQPDRLRKLRSRYDELARQAAPPKNRNPNAE